MYNLRGKQTGAKQLFLDNCVFLFWCSGNEKIPDPKNMDYGGAEKKMGILLP